MRNRAIRLTLLGGLVGPLLDRAHVWTGAIAYDTEVTALGVPWWVTLVYVGAALGIGLTHPALDRALGRPQKVELSKGALGLGFAGMAALWVTSGLLPASNGTIALVLAAGAGGILAVFDRTWQGVLLAAGTGLGGVVVEATLVRLGLFHHLRPDVWGLPVWLPFLYFGGSVAIGNLARAWQQRAGDRLSRRGHRLDPEDGTGDGTSSRGRVGIGRRCSGRREARRG